MKPMKPDTQLTHLGRSVSGAIPATVNVPMHRASTVLFNDMAHLHEIEARWAADEQVPTYGILNMPQALALEEAVAQIEGGYRALTYPSGLAAVAGALLAVVKSGDHVLMTDSCYGPGRRFCDKFLKRMGVETTYYDPLIGAGVAALMRPNTTVVYTESPGSYTFEIQDIPAISAAAHAHGAVVIMDNAWATGLLFNAFKHGVDLVIQPATKYYAAHSDVLIGLVIANEALWPRLKSSTYDLGQRASPDDCFLTLRGLRTMGVRLRAHEQSAMRLALWLQAQPQVARVLYPALETDPGHMLYKRLFTGASGLFAVELKDVNAAQVADMVDHFRYFKLGYSWGGFESLVMPASLKQYRTVTPWNGGALVRFSIGLEDCDDLRADLADGLQRLNA
jgi:cysteine-S-conjugate beta-lyase